MIHTGPGHNVQTARRENLDHKITKNILEYTDLSFITINNLSPVRPETPYTRLLPKPMNIIKNK